MMQRRPDRTLGEEHDTFWEGCKSGKLHLPRCKACHALAWPVVSTCEHCRGTNFSWEQMSGRGTIVSWCTFERDYYQGILPMPWDTILVELAEGPLFISNPHGFDADAIHMGMPVRVTFVECEDAAGRFDLPVFAADHDDRAAPSNDVGLVEDLPPGTAHPWRPA